MGDRRRGAEGHSLLLADRIALTIVPGRYRDARADALAILAYSINRSFPLAMAECGLHDFARPQRKSKGREVRPSKITSPKRFFFIGVWAS
jgi:hypothetical protein